MHALYTLFRILAIVFIHAAGGISPRRLGDHSSRRIAARPTASLQDATLASRPFKPTQLSLLACRHGWP